MFSVVLATMLTTGTATPDWGKGCRGCYSGCHGCYSSCYGCVGCYGCSGCYGCYGGCHGCYSSCSGCYGCYSSCYGCGGCYSSCYGCSGCYGCYSSCHGCYSSCHGCYSSCYGCQGTVIIIQQQGSSGGGYQKKEDKEKKEKKEKKKADDTHAAVHIQTVEDASVFVDGVQMPADTDSFTTPALKPGQVYFYTLKAVATRKGKKFVQNQRVEVQAGRASKVVLNNLLPEKPDASVARVTVELPADAKLYINDVQCPLSSSTRTFDTPKLQSGRKYAYTLKAEVKRNGRTLTETQDVIVQAGKPVSVEFNTLPSVQTARR